jgi:hypothetical protein
MGIRFLGIIISFPIIDLIPGLGCNFTVVGEIDASGQRPILGCRIIFPNLTTIVRKNNLGIKIYLIREWIYLDPLQSRYIQST